MGMTRRAMLGGGLVGATLGVAGVKGLMSAVADSDKAAFDLGTLPHVLADLAKRPRGVRVYQDLHLALVRYDAPPALAALHRDVAAGGVLALVNKCTHLGCALPEVCAGSGWFECACHGSRFNAAGDYQFGPAVRSMDRYKLRLVPRPGASPDHLVVDLTTVVPGLPRGTRSLDQPADGPHCEL
jgi:Rieske Fe-S protein